jgi:N-acetylglutamate synthase-like GNAT family acetyltransferase
MSYELRRVESEADWQAMHEIRRATLFAPDRHGAAIVYDDKHADDRNPDNHCLLFLVDGRPIGVARLDRRDADSGVVRLVAVAPDVQGKGYGRVMGERVEACARGRGMSELFINAAPTAIGFYEKTGWQRFSWDPCELTGIAARCVQMRKDL